MSPIKWRPCHRYNGRLTIRRCSCLIGIVLLVVLVLVVVVVAFAFSSNESSDETSNYKSNYKSNYRSNYRSNDYVDGEDGLVDVGDPPRCLASQLPLRTDIDLLTSDKLDKLNFESESVDLRGEFWNEALERRYKSRRSDAWSKLPLSVIVVPHSHNDPGWLKTFEQYFVADTARILDNVVDKMMKYEDLTFVWSEMSFLDLWFESAHARRRSNLEHLIASGRFEILTSGWVMSDEASVHLYAMVDQLVEGQQFSKANFHYSPKSAWSVDAFGHSSTMPYLLKASKVDNMVVVRIHYAWKEFMARQQSGDFKWAQPWDVKGAHDVLVHNHPYDIYSVKSSCGPHPHICLGFNFGHIPGSQTEYSSHYTPITPSNLKERSELLLEQYGKTGSLYPHNVVLVPLGDDFTYTSGMEMDEQYSNYKHIFEFINKNNYDAHVRFGTVSDYFKEVRARMKRFEKISGDFFVYSDIFSEGRPAYWSGYFTTRPYMKRLSRLLESHLRAAELLLTLAMKEMRLEKDDNENDLGESKSKLAILQSMYFDQLVPARRNLALFQHHDGITGTSKMYVMDDYGQRLFSALQQVQSMHRSLMPMLMGQKEVRLRPVKESKEYSVLPKHIRMSIDKEKVWLFNSLAQEVTDVIHLEMEALQGVQALCALAKGVKRTRVQVNPVWSMESGDFRVDPSVWQLSFVARLKPLSITVFSIEQCRTKRTRAPTQVYCLKCPSSSNSMFTMSPLPTSHSIEMENRLLRLKLDPQTRHLTSITRKSTSARSSSSFDLRLQFGAYSTSAFRNGAYLFKQDERANASGEAFFTSQDLHEVLVISGGVTSEVVVGLSKSSTRVGERRPYLVHGLRLYNTADDEMDGVVRVWNVFDFGDSDFSNDKDLFMRLSTLDIKDDGVFYTDSNGFQMMRRRSIEKLGLEANQYPITTETFIQDAKNRLTLLVDHAQSANSFNKALNENTLELIVDRKAYFDDSRGMGEGITDNRPTLHNYVILLESIDDDLQVHDVQLSSQLGVKWSRRLNHETIVLLGDAITETQSRSWLSAGLQSELHLLNLRSMTLFCQNQDNLCGQALLIVHRQTSDCRVTNNLESSNKRVYLDSNEDLVGQLKSELGARQVRRTSLTGTQFVHEKDINSSSNLVEPMNLASFLLNF